MMKKRLALILLLLIILMSCQAQTPQPVQPTPTLTSLAEQLTQPPFVVETTPQATIQLTATPDRGKAFWLVSPTFDKGQTIPVQYTCDSGQVGKVFVL